MYRPDGWRDLGVGLAAIAAVLTLTFVILVFGRIGRLSGDTYRVFVRAEEARGIMKGSEVWLNGQKVGAVRNIAFAAPVAADARRVVLELEVLERDADPIRHDSDVAIRSGGSLIGAPVVYIMAGSARSPVLGAGDTLVARDPVDMESIAARYAGASEDLPFIIADAKSVVALAKDPDGTLGAAMNEKGGSEMTEMRSRMGRIAARLRGRQGTLGGATGGGTLVGRAKLAMARADSIRQLLGSTQTSLGRFRRDTSLAATVSDIRDELTIVGALLAEPRGTLGRIGQDSAIVAGVSEAKQEMSVLFADLKRRPFRYLSF